MNDGPRGPIESLRIAPAIVGAVVGHLRSALPNEGCGLLATAEAEAEDGGERASRFFPGRNIDLSPTRFTMDPAEVAAAFAEMELRGWRLGAVVHSHPASPATPSPTDLREAYYPRALLCIVSFAGPGEEIRAWRVDGDPDGPPAVREVAIIR